MPRSAGGRASSTVCPENAGRYKAPYGGNWWNNGIDIGLPFQLLARFVLQPPKLEVARSNRARVTIFPFEFIYLISFRFIDVSFSVRFGPFSVRWMICKNPMSGFSSGTKWA